MSDLIPDRTAWLLLLLLGALAFGRQLTGAFIWDDTLLVLQNQLTGSWQNLPRFFTVSLWETTPQVDPNRSFYRPLMLVELWLDRALVEPPSPALHRLHNLVWHSLGVGLLAALLQRLRPGAWLALPAVALYALHPLQNEVVAFTAARNDSMASALMLGCLLVLWTAQASPRRLAAGAALFAAALLSKEVAVAAPLILAGLDHLRHGRLVGPRRHVVLWAVVMAYAALRLGLQLDTHLVLPDDPLGWAAHTARLLVAPQTTSSATYLATGQASWPALIAVVGLLAMVGLRGGAQARLGLAWAAITLLPCLPAVGATEQMPYRYLTLPLAGLAVAVHGAWSPRWPRALGGVLAAALAGVTLSQGAPWLSSTALWAHGWTVSPSPRTACGLFKEIEHQPGADVWLERATTAPPAQYCCFSATSHYLDRGDLPGAYASGRRALEQGCEPTAELLAPLAIAEFVAGEWDLAEAHALAAQPDPTGLSPLVLSAAALRRGDDSVLRQWSARGPEGSAAPLAEQVRWLLDQAGL